MTCPYCDSVYVTETAVAQQIMPPHAVIPFRVSHEQHGETYDLLVNGQTGAVVGKRPSRGVRGFFAKLFG